MGDINNGLEDFKNRIENKEEDKSMSTYVLAFMVGGVFTSLAYLFAYYAGQGFSSDQLYSCVWESVHVLEAINLKVLLFTNDGASPKRRFYRLRKMPHIIKTIWNNFENSHGHSKTRNLVVGGFCL